MAAVAFESFDLPLGEGGVIPITPQRDVSNSD
jgi:hypothetical protein